MTTTSPRAAVKARLITIRLDGNSYVIVRREEYDRLATLAKAGAIAAVPAADADGNVPAVEYARATLARKLISARAAAGLTQRALASAAGLSFEHVSRIESGRHSPNVATVAKLERALREAGGRTRRRVGGEAGRAVAKGRGRGAGAELGRLKG